MQAPTPHPEAEAELERAPQALRPTTRALFDRLMSEHQSAHLLVWPRQRIISFGHGPRKMSQHYAYIGIHARHVNLGFYRGSTLPDPARLLQGTGQQLRHVKLRAASDVQSEALRALMRSAIEERRGQD